MDKLDKIKHFLIHPPATLEYQSVQAAASSSDRRFISISFLFLFFCLLELLNICRRKRKGLRKERTEGRGRGKERSIQRQKTNPKNTI